MYNNVATEAIMNIGMKALRDALGVVDAEIFLINVKQERFDYTKWRQDNLWEGMSLEEILDKAAQNDSIGKSFGL
jgi:hypothetical protein